MTTDTLTPPAQTDDLRAVEELHDARRQLLGEIEKRIVGQKDVVDSLLVALFARGHCLFVGVPGLAKTLLISTLARILSLKFSRIQFTPDLMPSDITGTEILEEEEGTGRRHTYRPLFSVSGAETREDDRRYFNALTRIGPSGQRQTFVSLGGFAAANGDIPVETLSPEITATNGSLPREKLQEHTITQPAPDFPNITGFANGLVSPLRSKHLIERFFIGYIMKLVNIDPVSLKLPEGQIDVIGSSLGVSLSGFSGHDHLSSV